MRSLSGSPLVSRVTRLPAQGVSGSIDLTAYLVGTGGAGQDRKYGSDIAPADFTRFLFRTVFVLEIFTATRRRTGWAARGF
jgi:hypothetical protein